MTLVEKQEHYKETIKKVIVTYHDKYGWWIFKRNTKKSFQPEVWAIFENRIRKIAKHVQIIKK